ncbi:MAG: hypothetical protein AAGA56_07855, partial [Myxococcota bacterium]
VGLTVTLFNNTLLNLAVPGGVEARSFDLPSSVVRSFGAARGVEVLVRRSLARRIGGFFAYTFSRSDRRTFRQTRVPAEFDRTHVLQTGTSFTFPDGWGAGIRFNYLSGSPSRAPVSTPQRDPAFTRLDFRGEKRWSVGEIGYLSLVLECVNITARRQTLDGEELFPVVLPSVGLEGGVP